MSNTFNSNSAGGLNTNLPSANSVSQFDEPTRMSGATQQNTSAPVLFQANGHYYEFVAGNVSWDEARTAASGRSFNGRTGYLATITSLEENNFVRGLLNGNNAWLGGSDAATEGTWQWVTGPEANNSVNYTNWLSGEPNGQTNENYVAIIGNSNLSEGFQGLWHDTSATPNTGDFGTTGYIVEYGGLPTDQISQTHDIYWRNYTTGQNAYWEIDTSTGSNGQIAVDIIRQDPLATLQGQAWSMSAVGDFNADGENDIFFHNTSTGETQVWLMQRDQTSGLVSRAGNPISLLQTPANGWEVVGTADFDNNNIADLVWRNNSTDENGIWLMQSSSSNSVSIRGTYFIDRAASGWSIEHVADVNNNGRQDLVWRNNTTGQNAVWEISFNSTIQANNTTQVLAVGANSASNPFTRTANYFVTPTEAGTSTLAGIADFNGDNIADFLWTNGTTGVTKIWTMTAGTNGQVSRGQEFNLTNTGANSGWEVAGIANVNVDSTPDLIWRNYTSGANAAWLLNSSSTGITVGQTALIGSAIPKEWIIEDLKTLD